MLRIRRLLAAASVAAVVTAALVAPGSPASAATCTPSAHCYGVIRFTPGTIYGINQGLNVHCLGPMNAPTSSNFVTQEQWLATNNSSGQYWVEVGMAYGAPQGSTRYMFWADNRPNGGGYHEHDLSITAALNTYYDDYIRWIGNNSWRVERGGTTLGTSTANPGPSHWANAGEELTANGGAASAVTGWLYRQTSSGGAWISNWPGSTISTDNPPYGSWTTPGYSASFYSNCAFLTGASDPGPTFTPFSKAAAATAVRGLATQLAAANGDPAPSSMEYVLTTRQAAAKATSQAVVDSDQPVYVASFSGKFSGDLAKTPRGAVKPSGSVMTVVIDQSTGRITDWGIEKATPTLAALGAVQKLS